MKEIKVKYEKNGKHFEILVNEKVFDYLEGKVSIKEVLIVEEVFRDINKGERASEEDLLSVFETTNIEKIAEEIIKNGYIQIPTEIRRKWVEEKRKQIIDFIAKNAIDPKTKLPIPPQRIELALEQVKVKIDPFKGVEKQAEEIVKKLVLVMPIKFEKIKLAIKVPGEYYGKIYNFIHKEAKIKNEEWTNEGDWIAIVEIPGGFKVKFIDELSRLTNGEIQVKEL
ncbi:MAG: ribosome assembly factor SBDS [Nanoarchaeota archaeon]